MGVHSQIYCGCGAFPAADPVVSAARPCSDTMGRDRKTTDILHARLATVSLRAFDRDTGTFTLSVTPVGQGSPEDSADAEPITLSFLASEYITARPGGLEQFETFLRTARPGALFTFAGRWVTHSWVSRSGDIRETREFEATRMAEGRHDRATLCGPLAEGPLSCPALAARQLMEAHLPASARTPGTPPHCATPRPAPSTGPEPFPRRQMRLPTPKAQPEPQPAPWSVGRLLGLRPAPRILLSDPTPPPAAIIPCSTAESLPSASPCRNPDCCPPANG